MADAQSAASPGVDSPVRIGVYIDGGFWFHLTYYWLMNHPMKVRLSIDGLRDAIRWYARTVVDRPVEHIQVTKTHWVQGDESLMHEGFAAALDRLHVIRHHMGFNPDNGRSTGVRVELALTAWDEAYDDLDMVALLTGDAEYRPLVDRLVADKVRVLVPQIDVEFPDNRGGRPRWLVTSPHLLREATDTPAYEDLLGATETAEYTGRGLISPFLRDYDADRSGERAVGLRIRRRPYPRRG